MKRRPPLAHPICRAIRSESLTLSFWQKACDHEGIPATSSFVTFSPTNPYCGPLDRARSVYNHHRRWLFRAAM